MKKCYKKRAFINVNLYADNPSQNYQAKRIRQELEALGVSTEIGTLAYKIRINNDGCVDACLPYDFVVNLDKDSYAGEAIEKLNIRAFNKIAAISACDDKMLTHLMLSGAGVKMPKTVAFPLCYNQNAVVKEADISPVIDYLGLPVVVKLSFSSLGKGVFLAKTKEELLALANNYKREKALFQEFISSSKGVDVRIITVGKKYLCAMKRVSKADFRSNAALGGTGESFTPPESFINVAETVAAALDLDYMGIDLLFGESGEPVFCEANSNAFFSVMEKVSGVNVAKAYAEYMFKTVYGNSYGKD